MIGPKVIGIVWIIAVVAAAITIPLFFDFNTDDFNFRLGLTTIIILQVTYTAWTKAKVDRLQESPSFDADDEDFLFLAASHLLSQIRFLMVLYVLTLISIVALFAFDSQERVSAFLAPIFAILFTLSLMFLPALLNIDSAATRESHRRKRARHVREERAGQLQRIDSDEELPAEYRRQLDRHNHVLNGED